MIASAKNYSSNSYMFLLPVQSAKADFAAARFPRMYLDLIPQPIAVKFLSSLIH